MGQGRRDVQAAPDVTITDPCPTKRTDLFPADPFSGPSYLSSERPGSLEARPNAITHQRTLELPDGGHDVEDQLASRGRGVDVLFDRDKGHAAPTQMVKSRDELFDRASRAVEPLDDNGLKLSPSGVGQEPVELWPVLLRARRHIGGHEGQSSLSQM